MHRMGRDIQRRLTSSRTGHHHLWLLPQRLSDPSPQTSSSYGWQALLAETLGDWTELAPSLEPLVSKYPELVLRADWKLSVGECSKLPESLHVRLRAWVIYWMFSYLDVTDCSPFIISWYSEGSINGTVYRRNFCVNRWSSRHNKSLWHANCIYKGAAHVLTRSSHNGIILIESWLCRYIIIGIWSLMARQNQKSNSFITVSCWLDSDFSWLGFVASNCCELVWSILCTSVDPLFISWQVQITFFLPL